MNHEPDNSAPETYRDLVRRRHRGQTFRKRILVLLTVVVVVVGALVFWISQTMISPPRPRISESERPVIGVVLRDDSAGGAAVVSAVPPASAAGLRAGDRIVSVDGFPVQSARQLRSRIDAAADGELLRLEARRARPEGVVLMDVEVEIRAVSPLDLGLEFQEVAFSNPWGLTLRGWYIPPPGLAASSAPGIAYGHGNAADRRHWLDLAPAVHRAGFGQLLLDFSGRGESQGEVITLGPREAGDLQSAVEFLTGRPEIDSSRVYLAGRSMGAVAAILAAGEGAPVRALVLDSPFADLERIADEAISEIFRPAVPLRPLAFMVTGWRTGFDPSEVSPIDAVRDLDVPMLILHGTEDRIVSFEHSRDLAEAAAGPVRLVPIPGAGHNDPRPTAVVETILEFLRSS
jgi:pimeloyl-ACP methyl ester carboxylesterase